MNRVLDASALIAYLEKEPGYEKVKDAFIGAAESGRRLLMSAVNWGEVCYFLIRRHGLEKTKEVAALIETFPVEVLPADKETAKLAALYKAQKKLPYADSFAAATAKLHKGDLLTADKEFKLVENDIKITWL